MLAPRTSKERFAILEERANTLANNQKELRVDVKEIKGDINVIKLNQTSLTVKLDNHFKEFKSLNGKGHKSEITIFITLLMLLTAVAGGIAKLYGLIP